MATTNATDGANEERRLPDQEEVAALVLATLPAVHRSVCRRLRVPLHDRGDVLSELYLVGVRCLGPFSPDRGSFRAYFTTAGLRAIALYLKRQRGPFDFVDVDVDAIEVSVDQWFTRRTMPEARLTSRQRDALDVVNNAPSLTVAARHLGIGKRALRRRIKRAVERLRVAA